MGESECFSQIKIGYPKNLKEINFLQKIILRKVQFLKMFYTDYIYNIHYTTHYSYEYTTFTEYHCKRF